jgi:Domain of unknown function (DUF1963)
MAMNDIDTLRQSIRDLLLDRGMAALKTMQDEDLAQPLPTVETINSLVEHLAVEALPTANLRIEVKPKPQFLEKQFEIGQSRLSADPDMPDSMEWPSHNGSPLDCLAQIDLTSLPSSVKWPVPKQGWLYIFLGAWGDCGVQLRYFGGSLRELKRRRRRAATASGLGMGLKEMFGIASMGHGMENTAPYSVAFELGLEVRNNGVEPWSREKYPHTNSWTMPSMLQRTSDCKAWMFGPDLVFYVGHDVDGSRLDGGDAKLQAVISAMGYPYWARRLSQAHPPAYDHDGEDLPEVRAAYEGLVCRLPDLRQEAKNWGPIFSLPSLLHGSTGWGDGTWHYLWGDAKTLHVFADLRKTTAGDFSKAAYLIY